MQYMQQQYRVQGYMLDASTPGVMTISSMFKMPAEDSQSKCAAYGAASHTMVWHSLQQILLHVAPDLRSYGFWDLLTLEEFCRWWALMGVQLRWPWLACEKGRCSICRHIRSEQMATFH